MQHPFQCVSTIKSAKSTGHLLAASGSSLTSTCLLSGLIVSEWVPEDAARPPDTAPAVDGVEERPTKKQKPSPTTQSKSLQRKIIKLAISPNNEYAVVATDDKCIRVLSVDTNGILHELSSRCMPKRPSAIQVLPDNATILCGDKFGDVYSLPLLPSLEPTTEPVLESTTIETPHQAGPAQPNSQNLFKPSATDRTVHTQRNLKTLASQQQQKNLSPKTKEPLKFEHELLLGHVSMLTDLTHASRVVEGRRRNYIITSDRDEHIRISRAPPQAHVIEGYCLGHTEFVSKIFIVPGTEFLVSGGGDGWAGVWKWPECRLRAKLKLSDALGLDVIALSDIWVVSLDVGDIILMACEKVPFLAYVAVDELRRDTFDGAVSVFEIGYPVLDIAETDTAILVSLDVRAEDERCLRAFRILGTKADELRLESDHEFDEKLKSTNAATRVVSDERSLDDFLYTIEKLRKRGDYGEHEDAE